MTDGQIRHLYNIAKDGTVTDALQRHLCRVALGERVVHDESMPSEDKLRYPWPSEILEAKARLMSRWEQLNGRSD